MDKVIKYTLKLIEDDLYIIEYDMYFSMDVIDFTPYSKYGIKGKLQYIISSINNDINNLENMKYIECDFERYYERDYYDIIKYSITFNNEVYTLENKLEEEEIMSVIKEKIYSMLIDCIVNNRVVLLNIINYDRYYD